MASENYRTDDMGLVAYLRCEGFMPCGGDWNGRDRYWEFEVTDSLLEAANKFTTRGALVEPRRYNQEFAAVKRDLHRGTLEDDHQG